MADEYIRKKDAMDAVEYANGNITWAERDDCKKRLEELKSVDVVPVVHAHWKDNKNGTVSCSRCSTWFQKERVPYLHFCGYCGAKMDGKE